MYLKLKKVNVVGGYISCSPHTLFGKPKDWSIIVFHSIRTDHIAIIKAIKMGPSS